MKKTPQKVAYLSRNSVVSEIFPYCLTAHMAEFMFPNVTYRATVYRTGVWTNIWVTLIQNNLYSQQILSQVWYGNVPWQDRSTLYKIFHIFMLVVLAPLSAFLMFVFKIKGTTKVERQLKFDSFNQPDGISVAL